MLWSLVGSDITNNYKIRDLRIGRFRSNPRSIGSVTRLYLFHVRLLSPSLTTIQTLLLWQPAILSGPSTDPRPMVF